MRVLLVEDHPSLANAVLAVLRKERYEVRWAKNLEQAYTQLAEAEPDLILLDIMLPEGEDAGLELARNLRAAGHARPILFLTARDAVEDRIAGLDLGADDYLTKPFDIGELMARVRALLRREGATRNSVFEQGPLRLDLTLRRVWWAGQEVGLSDREFALLELLALHPGRIHPNEEIADRLFPSAETPIQTVRMYVMRLREKLSHEAIQTASGGYRLGLSD